MQLYVGRFKVDKLSGYTMKSISSPKFVQQNFEIEPFVPPSVLHMWSNMRDNSVVMICHWTFDPIWAYQDDTKVEDEQEASKEDESSDFVCKYCNHDPFTNQTDLDSHIKLKHEIKVWGFKFPFR